MEKLSASPPPPKCRFPFLKDFPHVTLLEVHLAERRGVPSAELLYRSLFFSGFRSWESLRTEQDYIYGNGGVG